MSKKNDLNILSSDGGMGTVQILADVDVDVTSDGGDDESLHIADMLYRVILERIRTQPTAVLKPGSYTVRVMITIVGEEDDDQASV